MTEKAKEGDRIAKVMARAGVCSRRDAERMIFDGRVTLNGEVLDTPAIKVTDADKIEVDGEVIGGKEKTRLWLYHKPVGLVTSHRDEKGRETVFDCLPKDMPRVISIGRLDLTSEGLLLLTNDGALSRHLELPATGWQRTYKVRGYGQITQDKLDRLKNGITVEGIEYGAIKATLDKTQGANVWITMTLREGKNREIRRILEHLNVQVNRLIRLSFGPFELGNLREEEVKEVSEKALRGAAGDFLLTES